MGESNQTNKKRVTIPQNTDLNTVTSVNKIVSEPKEILELILPKISSVNFREKAGIKDSDKKLNRTHYLVVTVEELLTISNKNNWDLAIKDDAIYAYNGKYWGLISQNDFKFFLGDVALKIGVEKIQSKHFRFRDDLYKQFFALAKPPSNIEEDNLVKINLLNGTYIFSENKSELTSFNKGDFMTYQLPFEFNPDSGANLFTSYLNRVLPEKELQNIAAEFIAYIFISPKNLKLEKALLLYGSGANGKSVFFEIISALLGDQNISNYSLKDLSKETHRAQIGDKLLNYASEISGSLDVTDFKALASGEPVIARHLYGKPFTMDNYAKLCFNCNNLPSDVEHTHAYFRRFVILPFRVTIPEGERDAELSKKIIERELSGVFNWVLEGLNRLIQNKNLTPSTIVSKEVAKFQNESDSVALFIEDNGFEKSSDQFDSLKDVYDSYRVFCIDDGYKPVNKRNFRKRLESKQITIARRNTGNVVFLKKK